MSIYYGIHLSHDDLETGGNRDESLSVLNFILPKDTTSRLPMALKFTYIQHNQKWLVNIGLFVHI